MLIHAEGANRGDAPVKIYDTHKESGCILVGDSRTRILLDPVEIVELYKLLGDILNGSLS